MFVQRISSAILVAMLLGAVSQPAQAKVRAFPTPGVDMSQYKTYQWLPTRALTKTGVVEDDPNVTPLIKEAVNREMTRLGLKEVAEGGDLQIAAGVTTQASAQLEAILLAGSAWGMYYATPVATMGRYNKKGSLIINLIDPRLKKSAWAAIAEENLSDAEGAGLKKSGKATEDIFKKYPVKK